MLLPDSVTLSNCWSTLQAGATRACEFSIPSTSLNSSLPLPGAGFSPRFIVPAIYGKIPLQL